MALINNTFPPSQEFNLYNWLGNLGQAILGRGNRWNFSRDYFVQQKPRVEFVDCSWGDLMRVAHNVPHLNVALSEGAKMFSNAEIKHYKADGTEIENSPIVEFLHNPNPLQGLEDWLYEFYLINGVYRNNFLFMNRGSALVALPGTMWWLPAGQVKVKLTGKMWRQVDIEGIIESYAIEGTTEVFSPAEVLHIREGMTKNGILAASRIESLQMPLSNIMAAMKSNNIILAERGLIGFIAGESGDSDGALPMSKDERERVEKDYQKRRSLDSNQSHITFTSASIKWVPMTFDVGQLKIYEGLEDAFAQVCGSLGLDRDIFPSTKGATFENKKQGEVRTYQSTMQPLLDKLLRRLSKQFGLTAKGESLRGSYDWLPVMKSDELKESQALQNRIATIATLVTANVINPAQAGEMVEAITDLTIDESLASTNGTIEKLTELSPLIANNMLGNLTINEVREMLGLGPIPGGDALAKVSTANAASSSNSSGTN